MTDFQTWFPILAVALSFIAGILAGLDLKGRAVRNDVLTTGRAKLTLDGDYVIGKIVASRQSAPIDPAELK